MEGGRESLETVVDLEGVKNIGIITIVKNGTEILRRIRSWRNLLDSSWIDVGVMTVVLTLMGESSREMDVKLSSFLDHQSAGSSSYKLAISLLSQSHAVHITLLQE